MKKDLTLILIIIFWGVFGKAQSIEKIVIDKNDDVSGYYLAVKPQTEKIDAVLVLLPGFGQNAESIFPETKLHNVGYLNNILTIGFATGTKLYADKETQDKLTIVLKDILNRYKIDETKFVIGGFSAGGTVALRYAELCKQYPNNFPINPKGVFVVDSPIDIFKFYELLEENIENKYSEVAVQEAEWVTNLIKEDHGIPKDNIDYYKEINPFSMKKKYGENEKWLKGMAVRTYHDVDIEWRLINRNQPVSTQSYLVTSELINRLILMGNQKAEFMQSYQTGYRSNGTRHPHSWSIVDEVECVKWIKEIVE
jgi:hypothetical protein